MGSAVLHRAGADALLHANEMAVGVLNDKLVHA